VAPERDAIDESSDLSPRVIHNHYTQSKNGNGGTNQTINMLLGLCGALLLILVAITGFMWSSQIQFQQSMIERMARVETRLGMEPPQP
jgi:hypothetical protein